MECGIVENEPSGSANVAELFDVQSRRKLKTMFGGQRLQPGGSFGQLFTRPCLRHQPDSARIDAAKVRQPFLHFFDVLRLIDHKLQDAVMLQKKRLNNVGPKSCLRMPIMPSGIVWNRIAELGADGHQITNDSLIDGPGRLDGDPFSQFATSCRQLLHFGQQHWFAARKHNIRRRAVADAPHQFIHRPGCAFRFPRCIGRVTKPAAQVAAGRPNEQRRRPGPRAFALNRFENFGYLHGSHIEWRSLQRQGRRRINRALNFSASRGRVVECLRWNPYDGRSDRNRMIHLRRWPVTETGVTAEISGGKVYFGRPDFIRAAVDS